jgi:hypothetical protein
MDGFQLLSSGFLYDDPYNAGLMTLFSSFIFTPLACLSVCAGALRSADTESETGNKPQSFASLVKGVLIGMLGAGLTFAHSTNIGCMILSILTAVCVSKHAILWWGAPSDASHNGSVWKIFHIKWPVVHAIASALYLSAVWKS